MKLAAIVSAAFIAFTMQQQPFRSTASAVIVDASVRDQQRRPIAGLTPADFKVLDNGVPQTVTDLSYGTRPIDVTIGLDISGSVTGSVLMELRIAVVRLVADLRPEDRLRLILFNNSMDKPTEFTNDVKAIETAVRRATPGGRTALYDSLSVSLVTASDPSRRQLIVFFTDGEDSGSKTTQAMLAAVAQRTRATMTFVVSTISEFRLPGSDSSFTMSQEHRVNPFLIQLAQATAGTVMPVQTSADVALAFKKVLADFRLSYVLFFTPTGVERGGFHNLSVDVARPGAIVQARRSYFAGNEK